MPEPEPSTAESSAGRAPVTWVGDVPGSEAAPRLESNVAELAARFAAHGGGKVSAEMSAELALQVVLNEIVEQACLATGATGAAVVLEREQARKQLVARARELTRSNADLEEFAYGASHDLQEPLRKIQAFGDRLKTKCGPVLGEQGLDYLERMQNAAVRMRTLINDLLTFSRVTTKAQPFARPILQKLWN